MTRSLPLRLRELFFPEVAVKAEVPSEQQQRSPEFELDDLEISFAFDLLDDGKRANSALRIQTKERSSTDHPKPPYTIAIEVFAHFDVVMPEHNDLRALYVRKFSSGTAMIGAAREQVSLMTARGPWGMALLPMISMDSIVGAPPQLPSNSNVDTESSAKLKVEKKVRRKLSTS